MDTATAGSNVKRKPVAGAIWGLIFGIGLSLILIDRGVIALGTLTVFVVPVLTLVLGVVWAFVAPAKKPKG